MAQFCDKPELLAPAGNMNALRLAIAAGADAVYFGAASFHARRATSETMSLKAVADYCHLFGVKAYLTINISIKEDELFEVEQLLKEVYLAKIDALIVTDLGILPLIYKHVPGIALHASTQLGIAAKEGALYLKELGFSRVILARECTVSDIRSIKEAGLEIEYFVHGALCVSFSGACLMSSIIAGNSGNRGLCKQPCRQKYIAETSEKMTDGYLLSTKDQCLILHLKELQDAGVCSFKIEGRLKRDAYQGGVTEIYRKALDGKSITESDFSKLKRLFNRGNFTEGYSFETDSVIFPKVQSSIGEVIGKIFKTDKIRAYFKYDGLVSSKFGFKVLRNGIEVNIAPEDISKCEKNIYSIQNNGFLLGDEICVTDDPEQNVDILKLDKKLPINIFAEFLQEKPSKVVVTAGDIAIEEVGDDVLQKAANAPMTKENLQFGLSKLGDTFFSVNKMQIETDGVFIAKSALNALRRAAIQRLSTALIAKNSPIYKNSNARNIIKQTKIVGVFCQVNCIEKALIVASKPSSFIVFSPEKYNKEEVSEFVTNVRFKNAQAVILLYTPAIIKQSEIAVLKDVAPLVDGFVCNNVSVFYLAKQLNKIAVAGVNLNIMNTQNPFCVESDAYLISAELNLKEIRSFSNGMLYAYGHLPLMNIRHCPLQTAGIKCADCKQNRAMTIKDSKYGYPMVRRIFKDCQFQLLNPILADLGDYAYRKSIYLDFTQTQAELIDKVFEDYYNQHRERMGEYTLLHMKRGVL